MARSTMEYQGEPIHREKVIGRVDGLLKGYDLTYKGAGIGRVRRVFHKRSGCMGAHTTWHLGEDGTGYTTLVEAARVLAAMHLGNLTEIVRNMRSEFGQ